MNATERHDPNNAIEYDNDALLPQKRVAAMLGVSPRALEAWRMRGAGPTFVKISSRCIRYRLGDVKKFIADRTHEQQ